MNKEYLSTDIPVSSLTYALKGQKLLEQKGFRAWAGRDHDRVQGCGYKLTVKGDAQRAKQLLQSGGIFARMVKRQTESQNWTLEKA